MQISYLNISSRKVFGVEPSGTNHTAISEADGPRGGDGCHKVCTQEQLFSSKAPLYIANHSRSVHKVFVSWHNYDKRRKKRLNRMYPNDACSIMLLINPQWQTIAIRFSGQHRNQERTESSLSHHDQHDTRKIYEQFKLLSIALTNPPIPAHITIDVPPVTVHIVQRYLVMSF